MPHSCCAYGCSEIFKKGGPTTFHSFPKDERRRRIWEYQVHRSDFKATLFTKICSKHFTPESFDLTKFGGTWLHPDAVPTIFDFPDEVHKEILTPEVLTDLFGHRIPDDVSDSDVKKPPKKRQSYMGDFDENDETCDFQLAFKRAKEEVLKLRKRIKVLMGANSNLRAKVHSLKDTMHKEKIKSLVAKDKKNKFKLPLLEPYPERLQHQKITRRRRSF